MNKTSGSHPCIALFTLNSAISSQSVNDFIGNHHDQISLVIVSNPLSTRRGGSIRQFIRHYRHSGLKYSLFLSYNFIIYPVLLAARLFISKLVGGKCRILSIREQCRLYNIQYRCCDNINDSQIFRVLEDQGVELIISCFFDQILSNEIVKIPLKSCLNIHPGILPACRGVFPEFHTAAGKFTDFGFTIHRIDDASIDTGRILLTRIVNVNGMKNMLMVGRKILSEGLTALTDILPEIDSHLKNARPQGDGNYYSHPDRADIRKLEDAGFTLW